ncbi:MAG: hypothetical protein O2992_01205 [Gemmatimonadetes bacterium]|jgi:hypothetical protein|nr:hypothetical protein [Gemmatimonadota bacterium]
MKILFKYTTRSRPDWFLRGLSSIVDNCVDPRFRVLVTLDEDDASMNHPDMLEELGRAANVDVCIGKSRNKIDATNRDLATYGYDWDILVNMSDDMVFVEHGFDDVIRRSFDHLDLCLHIPDGNRSDIVTLAILGRAFYDRFGYIYHPSYVSLWADKEMTEVAQILGCYKFVDARFLLHLHPAYRDVPMDEQYRHTESFGKADAKTYKRRAASGFGL